MEEVARRYVKVTVNRIGLRTWLFSSPYQASIENVKNTLVFEGLSFTSAEVFIDNGWALEVTLHRQA